MPKTYLHFVPAALLALLALGLVLGGLQYDTGSPSRMGPGFMPVLLGGLLLMLAVLQALTAWLGKRKVADESEAPVPLQARPLICASLSIVLWSLAVEQVGFVPAALGQLLLAYAAVRQPDWRQVMLHSGVVAALAFALFVLLLGLPLPALGA